MELVKYNILLNQQKQTVQQVIQEQRACHQKEVRFNILKRALIIMVLMFLWEEPAEKRLSNQLEKNWIYSKCLDNFLL